MNESLAFLFVIALTAFLVVRADAITPPISRIPPKTIEEAPARQQAIQREIDLLVTERRKLIVNDNLYQSQQLLKRSPKAQSIQNSLDRRDGMLKDLAVQMERLRGRPQSY
jgi:hypothetical protein